MSTFDGSAESPSASVVALCTGGSAGFKSGARLVVGGGGSFGRRDCSSKDGEVRYTQPWMSGTASDEGSVSSMTGRCDGDGGGSRGRCGDGGWEDG